AVRRSLTAPSREPYELARQLATLDHLSGGRAAWNVVTSSDAFTGENFRRGGDREHAERYERARWRSGARGPPRAPGARPRPRPLHPARRARRLRPARPPRRHPRPLPGA